MRKRNIRTFLTPALFEPGTEKDNIVVIIDILRATSSICTAFENGAAAIIPVAEAEEARDYKGRGYMVAAERDGYVLDFADFGNSPFNFTRDRVDGKTIVYSTTNGTGIINMVSGSAKIVVGSFINISALCEWVINQDEDVILFCAGWKNRFNLEDTICAGAIAERLFQKDDFQTICDSTYAALDLWKLAKNDPQGYIEKAAQRSRLRDKGLDDCIGFCLKPDYTRKIPRFADGILLADE